MRLGINEKIILSFSKAIIGENKANILIDFDQLITSEMIDLISKINHFSLIKRRLQ